MVNPAIFAGLLAGYTVGAVVTALAVAQDDRTREATPLAVARAIHPSATSRCTGAISRTRHAARCLRATDRHGLLTEPRR
jgi:hypothetical protein